MQNNDLRRKNSRTLLFVTIVLATMVGLVCASVPLYRLFCAKTGFNGVATEARRPPGEITDRTVKILFNADISPDLDWRFKPRQRSMTIRVGEKSIAYYLAFNTSQKSLSGSAVYNISPPKVAKYFHKLQCFCFSEQTLTPGEDVEMPVLFFIDPDFARDIDMDDVKTITLSYTFFPAESPALEQAVERFYNQSSGTPGADDSGTKPARESGHN